MMAAQIRIRSASTSVRRATVAFLSTVRQSGIGPAAYWLALPLPHNRTPLGKLALRKLGWYRRSHARASQRTARMVPRRLRSAAVRYRCNQSPPRLACASQERPSQDRQTGHPRVVPDIELLAMERAYDRARRRNHFAV